MDDIKVIDNITQNVTPYTQQTVTSTCKSLALSKDSVGDVISYLTCLIKESVMPLLVSLAVVGFVWGMMQYFLNPGNEEKRKKGKDFMTWGIIALFVIVSIWGIIQILSNTFGLGTTVIPQLSNEKTDSSYIDSPVDVPNFDNVAPIDVPTDPVT